MSTLTSSRGTVFSVLAACFLADLTALPAAAQQSKPSALKITSGSTAVTVRAGDRVILEYCPVAAPLKPYVKQLFTPGGVQILRDSVADHKHHHGLMFAICAGGVNFWEEVDKCGRESPDKFLKAAEADQSLAGFAQQLDWLTSDGRQVLKERRDIEVYAGIPATLVTWRTRLEAAGKKSVNLTGAHYHGLGMRFVQSMDKIGRFFNSDGAEGTVVHGTERVTPAKWCAYTSRVGDRPVTVAIFDHPRNTRPARFFTMTQPFSYLAATINVWKEPLELKPGEALDLRYGIALWDGETDRQAVEKLYRKWLQLEPER